jgi:prepilin-type N-terminal cleavage/methylation domain-containing protein
MQGLSSKRRSKRRAAGVTLIELMVVMTISAILLAVGVPAMSYFLDRNRVATEVNEFLAHMAWTASRGSGSVRAVLCRSTNGAAMGAVCGNADSDWRGGWIAFADTKVEGELPPYQRNTADAKENPAIGYARNSMEVMITANRAVAGLYITGGTVWLLDGNPLSSLAAGAYPLRVDFTGADAANNRSVCVSTTGHAHTSNTFGVCP